MFNFINISKSLRDRIINSNINTFFDRTLEFMKILYELPNNKEYILLSSKGFISHNRGLVNKILDKMYDYIFENFKNTISSKDVAEVICMNHSAFNRFFKRTQRKTFTQYLNEIRIGYACKLILESKYNINNISYDSGYNSISNLKILKIFN